MQCCSHVRERLLFSFVSYRKSHKLSSWSVVLVQRSLAVKQKGYFHLAQKLDFDQYFIIFSQLAWFICNDGSCERDMLSHNKWNMVWMKNGLVQFAFSSVT
jgi:hypothetical protein